MPCKIAIIIALVIVLSAGCPATRSCSSSNNCVVVPSADNSPPTVTMGVNDGYQVAIDVNKDTPPIVMVAGSDSVSVFASARDNDGGLKAVKLWASYTYYGAGAVSGPGLAGAPVQQAVSTAQIGETTQQFRLVAHTFDLGTLIGTWASLNIDVWMEGENFHGGTTLSPVVSIRYPGTQAGDTPYMAECRKRNVPIPPDWQAYGTGTGWLQHGNLKTPTHSPLGQPTENAFIWTHTDPEIRGACIAIARGNGAAGIICQSAITGNACFWDNILSLDLTTRLSWPIYTSWPIILLADGSNVPENCTDCHRGSNVFLIAPDHPVWSDVLRNTLVGFPTGTFTTRVEWSNDETGGRPRYVPVTLTSRPMWENTYTPPTQPACATCHEQSVFAGAVRQPLMPPVCATPTLEDCYR